MKKIEKDGCEYILAIPYTPDEELDQIIYDEIYAEAQYIADKRNGFIEADMVSLDDPERNWGHRNFRKFELSTPKTTPLE